MRTARNVAFVTCAATLVLVAVGAYVRATGSGLGCPDWPTCHGGVVPPNEREALIEFSHRFVAALVGLLVITTAVLAWRHFRHAPIVLWGAILTVPLVGFQGLLGAITVWQELPPEIVATHLLTAMLILSLMAVVAWGMAAELRTDADPDPASAAIARRALAALALFAAVVWIGGYMAESGATTACDGWPTCNGSIFPANDEDEVTHMAHRYIAGGLVLLLAPVVLAAWTARRALPWALPAAALVTALYLIQVMLGALNIWLDFPDPVTVGHTAFAAGLWFTLSATAVAGLYRPVRSRSPSVAGPAGVTA